MREIWPLHALVTVCLSLLGRERHSFGPSRLISRVRDAREMGHPVVVAHAGLEQNQDRGLEVHGTPPFGYAQR
jgi:hypothetical protein